MFTAPFDTQDLTVIGPLPFYSQEWLGAWIEASPAQQRNMLAAGLVQWRPWHKDCVRAVFDTLAESDRTRRASDYNGPFDPLLVVPLALYGEMVFAWSGPILVLDWESIVDGSHGLVRISQADPSIDWPALLNAVLADFAAHFPVIAAYRRCLLRAESPLGNRPAIGMKR